MLRGPQYNKNYPKNAQLHGFTIIEVVLVLAIASLLFLIVFLSIPVLQKKQQDKQRQQDIVLLRGVLENQRVNGGGMVVNTQAKMNQITATSFTNKDPKTGLRYVVQVYNNHTDHEDVEEPPVGTIYYVSAHKCGSDAESGYGPLDTLITSYPDDPNDLNLKRFSLLTKFESTDSVFCYDSYY